MSAINNYIKQANTATAIKETHITHLTEVYVGTKKISYGQLHTKQFTPKNNPINSTTFTIVPAAGSPKWIERPVSWIRSHEKGSLFERICAAVLSKLTVIALSIASKSLGQQAVLDLEKERQNIQEHTRQELLKQDDQIDRITLSIKNVRELPEPAFESYKGNPFPGRRSTLFEKL
jgi:hypothetical protein